MSIEQREGPLIEPVYSQLKPNEPIDLGSVPVQFTHKGEAHDYDCRVDMRFTPKDELRFVAQAKGVSSPSDIWKLSFDDDRAGKLELTGRAITLDAFVVGSDEDNGALAFKPRLSCVTATPPAQGLITATFHLFNFPDFFGPSDYSIATEDGEYQKGRQCGRAFLKAHGWSITIAATDRTHDLCRELDREGGFVITHVGKIERENGSAFASGELEHILSCLHYFLSLCLGRWAGVALPVGLDVAGKRVFEQWGLPIVAPGSWKCSCSWFDNLHGDLMSQVFPGFVALWNNPLWNQAIRKSIYWYLAANERATGIGVDTGVILAQAALELLAWTYCVKHRRMISPEGFEARALPAPDKLRLLISSLAIPLELPTCLASLRAEQKKLRDSMGAITTIRNTLVHPETKQQPSHEQYVEVWKLSLWCLDLVFLHLCGHDGAYANRLMRRWSGQVEAVPWAEPKTAE